MRFFGELVLYKKVSHASSVVRENSGALENNLE